ncbi:hypothetical protein T4B_11390 [Trichinella pseudospiralis]|uniref:Uncharacterized protein n=1 Tax=Trichinella pseudospiralis TaxID=6337 RepID=A0A0V1J2G9_TRIPS|nr:hypothetical protein T4B_11390 [Trichinella pseudospiralis]
MDDSFTQLQQRVKHSRDRTATASKLWDRSVEKSCVILHHQKDYGRQWCGKRQLILVVVLKDCSIVRVPSSYSALHAVMRCCKSLVVTRPDVIDSTFPLIPALLQQLGQFAKAEVMFSHVLVHSEVPFFKMIASLYPVRGHPFFFEINIWCYWTRNISAKQFHGSMYIMKKEKSCGQQHFD